MCAQLGLTLCDPMDCSPSDSSIHGIFQARILEWFVIYYCKGYSKPRDWIHVPYIGRWILYHFATWEAHNLLYVMFAVCLTIWEYNRQDSKCFCSAYWSVLRMEKMFGIWLSRNKVGTIRRPWWLTGENGYNQFKKQARNQEIFDMDLKG